MSARNPTIEIDRKGDTAYVTLGTGEPCYCEEFDDMILVERGIYSDLVGGFRILDISKYKKGDIHLNKLKGIVKAILVENSHIAQRMVERDELIRSALDSLDKTLGVLAKP